MLSVGASARTRRGVTLAELLVALALSGIVLGTATSSLLRQQRTAVVVGGSAASSAQLRAATGALAAELAPLAAGTGDLLAGEGSDTTLGLRSFVTGGVSCDDAIGQATLALEEGDAAAAGHLPRVGDSLWWHAGAAAGWRGRPIVSSDSVNVPCTLTGAPAHRRVMTGGADSIPFGAHLRVTRRSRYVFYRSGDGSWQLGLQEWVPEAGRLAAPQPIAGPFVRSIARLRTGFRYFDGGGREIPAGSIEPMADRIARVRVTVLMRASSGGTHDSPISRDSVDVALQPPGAP